MLEMTANILNPITEGMRRLERDLKRSNSDAQARRASVMAYLHVEPKQVNTEHRNSPNNSRPASPKLDVSLLKEQISSRMTRALDSTPLWHTAVCQWHIGWQLGLAGWLSLLFFEGGRSFNCVVLILVIRSVCRDAPVASCLGSKYCFLEFAFDVQCFTKWDVTQLLKCFTVAGRQMYLYHCTVGHLYISLQSTVNGILHLRTFLWIVMNSSLNKVEGLHCKVFAGVILGSTWHHWPVSSKAFKFLGKMKAKTFFTLVNTRVWIILVSPVKILIRDGLLSSPTICWHIDI